MDIAAVNAPKAARLLFQLPPTSRTFIAQKPALQWGWNEVLLNKVAYHLELLGWMKTKDAQKRAPRNRPKPFVPDFMGGQVGKDTQAMEIDDLKKLLARPRE